MENIINKFKEYLEVTVVISCTKLENGILAKGFNKVAGNKEEKIFEIEINENRHRARNELNSFHNRCSRLSLSDRKEFFDSVYDTSIPYCWREQINLVSLYEKSNNINEFEKILKEVYKNSKLKYDAKILSISNPEIFRETENRNNNSFDFVKLECKLSLADMNHSDKVSHIKRYKKVIDKFVLEAINNSTQFKKFGVPINYLRLGKCTLIKNDILLYQFELKNV